MTMSAPVAYNRVEKAHSFLYTRDVCIGTRVPMPSMGKDAHDEQLLCIRGVTFYHARWHSQMQQQAACHDSRQAEDYD